MIEIYGHPFAAFAWKPLIAAYERNVPITFRMVDPEHTENCARMIDLSPTGQFPALVDGEVQLTQSNAIIEYLDQVGGAPPLIPADAKAALLARMLAEVFDDYIAHPMQRVVAESLRPKDQQDPRRVDEAKRELDKTYLWLSKRISGNFAAGNSMSIADCAAAPALFYADWVHPIPDGSLKNYRSRLLAHPSVARVVDEARPYRAFFPLGAPDRD